MSVATETRAWLATTGPYPAPAATTLLAGPERDPHAPESWWGVSAVTGGLVNTRTDDRGDGTWWRTTNCEGTPERVALWGRLMAEAGR